MMLVVHYIQAKITTLHNYAANCSQRRIWCANYK